MRFMSKPCPCLASLRSISRWLMPATSMMLRSASRTRAASALPSRAGVAPVVSPCRSIASGPGLRGLVLRAPLPTALRPPHAGEDSASEAPLGELVQVRQVELGEHVDLVLLARVEGFLTDEGGKEGLFDQIPERHLMRDRDGPRQLEDLAVEGHRGLHHRPLCFKET